MFQYPQTDRRGCNKEAAAYAVSQRRFQYPQTDRRGCNHYGNTNRKWNKERFSIHKRIEGGATFTGSKKTNRPTLVSVSTNGSKGVQHPSRTLPERDRLSFSIHKRIEGGATPPQIKARKEAESFSIHKRIEGGATTSRGRRRVAAIRFQYPQTDRRGCNSN